MAETNWGDCCLDTAARRYIHVLHMRRVVTGWLRESDFGRLVGLIVTGWLRVSDDFGRQIGRSVTGWLQGSDFGRLVGLILSDWMDVRV